MKLAAISLSVTLALAAAPAYAQSAAPKGGHEHGAPPPCCDTGTPVKAHKAAGVVKKADPAKSTVTSKAIGTNAGSEFRGFPPTSSGQSTAEVHTWNQIASPRPRSPATSVT